MNRADGDKRLPHELEMLVRSNSSLLDIFTRSVHKDDVAHFEKEGNCVNIWRDMCLLAFTVCEGDEDGE